MDRKEHPRLYDICCGIGISSRQWKINIQYIDCVTTIENIGESNFTGATIHCGSASEGLVPFKLALNTPTDFDIMYMVRDINVQEHVESTNTNQAEVLQLLTTDIPEQVLLEVKSYERAHETFTNTSLDWILQLIVGKDRKHLVRKHLVSSSLAKGFLQRFFTEGYSKFRQLEKLILKGQFTKRACDCHSVQLSDLDGVRNTISKYFLSDRKMTIHGPAVTDETIADGYSTDRVFCFLCYKWPTAAHEWIDRERQHGWPSQNMIDHIMNEGCELVPGGRKDHPDEDLQWKLSFSRAETRLIRNFNIYQAQCYQLLKIVKHHFISSAVPDSLSSYHIKTVMFHTIEQTEPKVWRKYNLAQCFMMCLSNLKLYLTDKFLPQYFIVRQNLLEPKVTGDVHQKVLEIVTNLDKEGWKCILRCPDLQELCRSIQETVGSIPYNAITDSYALEENTRLLVSLCKEMIAYIWIQRNIVSYDCYLTQIVVFCEKPFLKPTATHPSVELVRVLQLLLKGELGIMLTVIQAMTHPDFRPGIDQLMTFARQCLEESCHADVSSCRLKLATFFFHLGEYDRCIHTVQDVLERFNDVWIVAGMGTNDDKRREALPNTDTSKLQFKLNRVLQLSDNGFPFISNHMSFPVFFTSCELAVAPKGIRFVQHTVHSHNVLLNEVCFIDSIVYAHYLLMESYLKIDEHNYAVHALINMKESIRNRKDDMFDRNCLCFCTEDKVLLHYSKSLMPFRRRKKMS